MQNRLDRIHDDAGVTLTFVAISLFLLLGFAALAIDFGIGFLTLRDAQNAAESAAVAAALESCNETSTYASPEQAGIAAAAANDFDASDVSIFRSTKGWGAELTPEAPTTFLGFFGIDSLPITTVAEASCPTVEPLLGAAIFAETFSCFNGFQQLNLASSTIYIEGDIISNSNLKISAPGTIDGDIYYAADESLQLHPSLVVTGEEIPTTFPIGYPPELLALIDDDDGNGAANPGDSFSDALLTAFGSDLVVMPGSTPQVKTDEWLLDPDGDPTTDDGYATLSGTDLIVDPGYYYTEGDIELRSGGARVRGAGVTFIAEGRALFQDPQITGNTFPLIDPSGNPVYIVDSDGNEVLDENGNPVQYDLQLTVYSGDGGATCNPSQPAIQSTGAISWGGVLFAPFGEVDFSGASAAATINGSVFGFQVSSSGSELTVVYDPPDTNRPFATVNVTE